MKNKSKIICYIIFSLIYMISAIIPLAKFYVFYDKDIYSYNYFHEYFLPVLALTTFFYMYISVISLILGLNIFLHNKKKKIEKLFSVRRGIYVAVRRGIYVAIILGISWAILMIILFPFPIITCSLPVI